MKRYDDEGMMYFMENMPVFRGEVKWPSPRPHILFLGAGNKTDLVMEFAMVTPNIWSVELEEECPISQLGVEIIKGPAFTDTGFPKFIKDLVTRLKIDVVIPLMDSATVALSMAAVSCLRLVSSTEMCFIHNDKILANEWFQSYSFNVPPEGNDVWRHRHSYGSRGVYFSHKHKKPVDDGNYVKQKFIHGVEYSIDCYVGLDGEPKVISPRQRMYVVGGEVMNSRTVEDGELTRLAESIIRLGGFYGPINIQVIRDDYKIYVIEMNLRFPGGAPLTINAGGNMAQCVFNDLEGKTYGQMKVEPNVLMVRAREGYYFRRD